MPRLRSSSESWTLRSPNICRLRQPPMVVLSEELASRSEANPQSKHPYIAHEPCHKIPEPL